MLLDNVLIIFIKYPQPGFVKTRLAKDIGKENASILYRLFVEAVLSRTKDRDFKRIIFYYPPESKNRIRNWIGQDYDIYAQKGIDLGNRLSNAFEFTFKKGAKRVIAIGTDSPHLDKKIILKGFKELENKPSVVGPTLDGGYYLLGLSQFHQELFQDISWGTHKVFRQTLDILKKLKIKFSLLEKELDVDTLDDLILLKNKLAVGDV